MNPSVFSLLNARILSHYESARKILSNKMPAPRTAILYPTYVCNQACPGCEYQEDNRGIARMMTRAQLMHAVDELAALGVQGLEFCGGGEPTLHPDLAQAILRLRKRGISIGLLTNGTHLTGKLAKVAVRNLSYIRISLDAADAATFNRVKRPKDKNAGFAQVVANIRKIVALRKKDNAPVTLSIKYLVSRLNAEGLEKAAKLAASLGVDSLQFKSVRIFKGLELKKEGDAIRRRIDALAKKYPKLAVLGGIDKANVTMKCWLSPVQIMIDAIGEVFVCCYYRHRRDTHGFGNIFKTPLKKIWFSKRHWKAIASIKPAECNRLDCRFAAYNQIMADMMIKDKAQFDFI
ncbi:MAG: radical SAM protein [Fibrobacterota bacterium]